MNDAKQATPAAELERQICSATEPKNEREWWAHREIERLRDRLSVETLALVETLARAERAEANAANWEEQANDRVSDWDEVRAERDALRADAERYRHLRDIAGNDIMRKLMEEVRPSHWDSIVDAAIAREKE